MSNSETRKVVVRSANETIAIRWVLRFGDCLVLLTFLFVPYRSRSDRRLFFQPTRRRQTPLSSFAPRTIRIFCFDQTEYIRVWFAAIVGPRIKRISRFDRGAIDDVLFANAWNSVSSKLRRNSTINSWDETDETGSSHAIFDSSAFDPRISDIAIVLLVPSVTCAMRTEL